jgi:hypothetical protein
MAPMTGDSGAGDSGAGDSAPKRAGRSQRGLPRPFANPPPTECRAVRRAMRYHPSLRSGRRTDGRYGRFHPKLASRPNTQEMIE